MQLIQKITNLIFSGHYRSVKTSKNILISFFLRGLSISLGFLLVPLTLDYLDNIRYGIWQTVSSFLIWFMFFEIGLGSGLKTKLSEALALKDYGLAKVYISTTYAILGIIIGIVAVIFFTANQFVNWALILNTDLNMAGELYALSLIVFGFFFIRFIAKLINIVLLSDQRYALNSMLSPLTNGLSLVVIYSLSRTTQGSLIYVGLVMSAIPVVILILASIFFYNKDYKKIAPSIYHVKFKNAGQLFGLGLKFFIIQMSSLAIYQTSNFIIARYFGPEQVTPYYIAYTYFSVALILYTIIISPFWTTFTEAWVKKEFDWIKRMIKKLCFIWVLILVISAIQFIISDLTLSIWIGADKMQTIHISRELKILLVIYFAVHTFGAIFINFLNGVGKISLQLYGILCGAIIFFPTTYLMVRYFHLGIEGVVLAMIAANFFGVLIGPIQYYKLINHKAKGIWNK